MYGVAIPTADGIRKVLELVGANKYGGQRVLWHNLREEPVCFFTSFAGCFFVFLMVDNEVSFVSTACV